ncbi:MAG: choice-of-anchor V domain-containing protein [Bryobacteraceae bacterium]|nr:choice-of-anchor V domain-containing protein [Bryobacteraceae bacterium]
MRKLLIVLLAITPAVLLSRTVAPGPPVFRTGNPADQNGATCNMCHGGAANAPNSNPAGKLTVNVASYRPGERQRISVSVEHPEGARWGFQLTARLESDPTKQAGRFIQNDTVFVRCGAAGLPQPPCNGEVEHVNHTAESSGRGVPGGYAWEFDWVAPEENVGKIIFFAAGNAANGTGNNQGDFIYTTSVTIEPAAVTTGRPAITASGIRDAFNFNSAVASHTWLAIRGTNLASTTRSWDDAIQGRRLPTTLSGVSVTVNNKPATISYVSPEQVNVLTPLDDATGMVPVVVKHSGGDSEAMMVNKTAAAPAFFTPVAQGANLFVRAAALDGTLLGKTGVDAAARRAARPGETIALFGTGFGATNPAVPADEISATPAPLVTKPVIRIGDVVANFDGNGVLVGPGLYQFNITVPATLTAGDHPIVAEIGSIRSLATVRLSVAP